jgi:C4-dicarboxylate-specific signal transduction histidine kinase
LRDGITIPPPTLLETLEEMQWLAKRAADIVTGLRKFLRPQDEEWTSVDVNDVVQEAVLLIAGQAQRHDAGVSLQLAGGIPRVRANAVQLEQVLVNLMVNGLEAMAETEASRRELTVSTATDDEGNVHVSVSDQGPGLCAEAQARMFDAFFTTKPEGLGMGLSICRTIIEAHGGNLWATANTHRGTTFHFTAPVRGNETP